MFGGNDRGVSETVGFVLVFSMVVTTVGVVYAVGYGGLADARNVERVDNAERAFEVLSANVEDLTRRAAWSRTTEIRLASATLRGGEPIEMNVSGDAPGTSDDFYTGNVSLSPVVFELDDDHDRLRYVGGAVLRGRDRMVMVEEPSFVVDGDRVLIPIVETTVVGTPSVGGSTTVVVRTERTLSDVIVASDVEYENVTIRLHTSHTEPWRTYFEAQGMTCPDDEGDADTLVCRATDVDRLSVVIYDVDVSFE